MVMDLLEHMDHAFGDVCEYDTMICSLYEMRQKEGESLEEYMLWIHKAVANICHAYPDRVKDQGKNLARDQFYYGLAPSLLDPWGSRWQSYLIRSKLVPVFTHCTLWLRRWRHVSLHVHIGGARVFQCLLRQLQEIPHSCGMGGNPH